MKMIMSPGTAYHVCLVIENSRILPFGFLLKTELYDLMGVDLPSQLDLLPSFEIASKLTNFPDMNSCDLDENLVQTINSSYHKTGDLLKVNKTSHSHNFSLFHVNIRSLTKHFDKLHLLLHSSKIPFDIIGISKSKQLINRDFPQVLTLMIITTLSTQQKVHVEEWQCMSKILFTIKF